MIARLLGVTFLCPSTTCSHYIDRNGNGRGDSYTLPYLGLKSLPVRTFYQDYSYGTTRSVYEFNIGNLSLAPNTIKSAKFNVVIRSLRISPDDDLYVVQVPLIFHHYLRKKVIAKEMTRTRYLLR